MRETFVSTHKTLPWRAGAGRELLAIGPFPRQRAGAAKWGEKRALTVANGMATTAQGRVPSKTLRPA
jgi:hypothetical protein